MVTRRDVAAGFGTLGLAAIMPRSQARAWLGLRQHPVLREFVPIPIAIPSFVSSGPPDGDTPHDMSQVITNDLKRSGLFSPIDSANFVERITDFDQPPQFASWRPLNALALVTGRTARQDDGRLKVEFRLWDVVSGEQLAGERYVAAPDDWRRVAHSIADRVYSHMTGETGYFDSRVAFVAESGPAEQRAKRLALMDQDGANVRYLTPATEALAAEPQFSPQGRQICYLEFVQGKTKLCLLDIETGQRESIDDLPSVPLLPRFSPDGRCIVMSLLQGDRVNLFVMDLESKRISRLTDTPAIDTSPSYSPDGSQICFESHRGGGPQIYVLPAKGGVAQRISFGDGSYATPVWSPRGDQIAFAKQGGGAFAIGIMTSDGSGERILTAGFHDDSPTFAPNGRVLMFCRKSSGRAGSSLVSIDVSGRSELTVPTPGDASDPAWSPLLA
jgi:TolB protein